MKIQESRKHFVLFYMAGFFVGILYANLQSKDYIASMGIFNEFFLNQYSVTSINMQEYAWYIIRVRLTPIIVITVFGYTKLKKVIAGIFLLWTGFSSGLIITAAVMKMGVKGIILCLIAVFPHFILYIAGYLILLWYLYGYPKVQWNAPKTIVFFLLIAVGIILECYVNPVIMQMFIQTL